MNFTLVTPDDTWVNSMQGQALPECLAFRTRHRADVAFIVTMAGRIIQMQSGFAMLESAYAQPNNAANIMMKNLLDLCIGVLAFYLFGYTIAFGESYDVGIADAGFDLAHWFCSFSYATTAATINSGALAGRVAFFPYLALSTMMTGLVYPISARLVWGHGWLQQMGFVDFAGSATVHLVGAVSALVSTMICGPRIGRFPEYRSWRKPWSWLFGEKHDDQYYRVPQDPVEKKVFISFRRCRHPVQLLFGTFLLLVGFLAFNPASTFSVTSGHDLVMAHASATTLLAAAGAGIGGMAYSMARTRSTVVRVPELTNALIGGLVASCACCVVIPLPVAPLVGLIAALLTLSVEELLAYFQVDDAVGAVAAHGPSGAWGTLAVSLFAEKHCSGNSEIVGLFFGGGEEAWKHLGIQCTGILMLTGISLGFTYVIVMLVDFLFGFRCSRACELIGLDFWEHQFDDGSLQSNNDKAALFDLAQMREDLSRRNRHLDSVVPKKWRSPSKSYVDVTESVDSRESRARTSTTSQSMSSESTDLPKSGESAEPAQVGLSDQKDPHIAVLTEKVADLERKIALLTLGHLRQKGERKGTTEDVCGTRVTAEAASQESSPMAPLRTTRSDPGY
ncbi:unnamed protein product [Durusdinium trenchii]|uniref:Ammonium transporter sll0108 n=3 Tax=Durusdinium trenchii TaxID=1381693 RepID=A0ABP0INP7_9DINO